MFGASGPPVTSFKGVTGHSLGAAGALEAVGIVLGMQKGLIPPTAGYETPDPDMAPIDLVVGEAREWTPGPTLSNSFGFGGHNGCVVIGPASVQLTTAGHPPSICSSCSLTLTPQAVARRARRRSA